LLKTCPFIILTGQIREPIPGPIVWENKILSRKEKEIEKKIPTK
jgi:hypothetical protein